MVNLAKRVISGSKVCVFLRLLGAILTNEFNANRTLFVSGDSGEQGEKGNAGEIGYKGEKGNLIQPQNKQKTPVLNDLIHL